MDLETITQIETRQQYKISNNKNSQLLAVLYEIEVRQSELYVELIKTFSKKFFNNTCF